MASNPLDFTVAIPTYNGANRLPLVLERLTQQARVETITWEILIIDNNSQDGTAELIRHYQAHWPHSYPLRYVFEAQQGAAFARLRGVQAAQGNLIGFLDDDNLPDERWVAAACEFAQTHPQAGAYGGQIHIQLETTPPPNFGRIKGFLAIRERGDQPHPYEPEHLILPPTAALVVRKQAWTTAIPAQPLLTGPTRNNPIGGEDYEISLRLHHAGWQIWYNPAMHTYHQIPHWRLEKEYLLSLSRGCGLCIYPLRTLGLQFWQKPWLLGKMTVGSLRRLILHWLKYRQQIKTDLAAACEAEFYWATLISPWFFLKQAWETRFS